MKYDCFKDMFMIANKYVDLLKNGIYRRIPKWNKVFVITRYLIDGYVKLSFLMIIFSIGLFVHLLFYGYNNNSIIIGIEQSIIAAAIFFTLIELLPYLYRKNKTRVYEVSAYNLLRNLLLDLDGIFIKAYEESEQMMCKDICRLFEYEFIYI